LYLEHCIAPFLNKCDVNNDHMVTLEEWGNCLEIPKVRNVKLNQNITLLNDYNDIRYNLITGNTGRRMWRITRRT